VFCALVNCREIFNFQIQYFFNTFNTAWEPWGRNSPLSFSHKDHEELFWCDLQKRSCVFLQTLGAIFWRQQRWAPFLPRFSEILSAFFRNFARIFNVSKLLGCACTSPTPTSYTTASTWLANLRQWFLSLCFTKVVREQVVGLMQSLGSNNCREL